MFTEAQILIAHCRAVLERLCRDERGYSTDAVVTTALLAALAIAVIIANVTQKADSIQL